MNANNGVLAQGDRPGLSFGMWEWGHTLLGTLQLALWSIWGKESSAIEASE
ncbi:MAG: hypothetical protein AAFS06_21960 [Cyanobacteria bacterium J06631_12]